MCKTWSFFSDELPSIGRASFHALGWAAQRRAAMHYHMTSLFLAAAIWGIFFSSEDNPAESDCNQMNLFPPSSISRGPLWRLFACASDLFFSKRVGRFLPKGLQSWYKPTHHLQFAKVIDMSLCCLAINMCAVAPESQRTFITFVIHPFWTPLQDEEALNSRRPGNGRRRECARCCGECTASWINWAWNK